ncbi:hypothetical protein DXG01_009937 [Tephrocybe rancida]|nr:hypothetical protein DXG01_009937 [Tephrocybe rancida]
MLSSSSQHNTPLPPDLLALSDLSPPSPVSSPTELTSAWSWSDIQIELDFSIDGVEDTPCLSRSAGHCDGRLGLAILPSSSISTVDTAGTFGPEYKRHKTGISSSMILQHSVQSSLSTLEEDVLISRSVTPVDISYLIPTSSLESEGALDHHDSTADSSDESRTTPSSQLPLRQMPSPVAYLNDLYQTGSQDSEIITTSRILNNISDIPPSYDSLFLPPSDSCPEGPKTRSSTLLSANDAPANMDARRLALAATLATLENKCLSEPSTPDCATRVSTSYGLPENLSTATVEILIDQEGFRGVFASFKYIGLSVFGPSGGGGRNIAHAQFRPTKRQAFNFHYAALEALPVLRRITVNGEESRDYISRQASLGLKSNGVYFVQGCEALSFPLPEGAAPASKLHWRFEYLVDDRRIDTAGKHLSDGEKILTPLSFSCSPLLLHPLQGKRVRLMQVMVKSVIPKLVAEKMEPPKFPPNIEPRSDSGTRSIPPPSYATDPRRNHNSHKRSATIWVPHVVGSDLEAPPLPTNTACEQRPAQPNRRRRASSAGERSLPGGSLLSPYVGQLPRGSSPICQNIIPPSRLIALADEGTSRITTAQSAEPSMCTDVLFKPLSPSPRRHLKA